MEGSRPYGGVNNINMQLERYHQGGPPHPHELRSYHSASLDGDGERDTKKGSTGMPSRAWSLGGDADIQRKKRVASYKMYGVEGKVKGSFRKSFRWLKDRYSQVVYGWR